MAKIDEKVVQNHCKILGISREEALQLIADDEAVDKMVSIKEVKGDLTEEQKKAERKLRQVSRKPTVYNFDTSKRKRAENTDKRTLINLIKEALENGDCEQLDVTNAEREIIFYFKNTKYKVVLSAPRT